MTLQIAVTTQHHTGQNNQVISKVIILLTDVSTQTLRGFLQCLSRTKVVCISFELIVIYTASMLQPYRHNMSLIVLIDSHMTIKIVSRKMQQIDGRRLLAATFFACLSFYHLQCCQRI